MTPRRIPSALPPDAQSIVDLLRNAPSKSACLQMAYDAVTERYHGDRWKTITRIWELFPLSFESLWKRRGFAHCTNFNWMMRTFLLHSGKFTEQDMETHWTLLRGFSPHQYVRVRTENGWVPVDAWGKRYGILLGDYAHGFHAGT